MSTTTYGQPATIDQAPTPRAAVNISSSTNGAGTVITTSSAHGLHTGEAAIISGHLLNTNANGVWIVTVTASDTFKISTFAGFPATFIAGNAAGGATGTVQSLALPGTDLPEDAVDDIEASIFNVPYEALLNMTAWLAYKALANATILKGGSLLVKTGATMATESGAPTTLDGTLTANQTSTFNSSAVFNGPTFLQGSTTLSDPQRLTNADHTISAHDGQVVILDTPSAVRVITVEQATNPPLNAQWIDFWLNVPNSAFGSYSIKRQGSANIIASLTGSIGGADETGHVRIHVEGGVWRLTGGHGFTPGLDA